MDEIKVRFTRVKSRRFYMLYYDFQGKRHWKSSKATSNRDASLAAIRWEQELGGIHADTITVWDDAKKYVFENSHDLSEKSLVIYRTVISIFEEAVKPSFADITQSQVDKFTQFLHRSKRQPSTIKNYLIILKAFLNRLLKAKKIKSMPSFMMPKQKHMNEVRGKAISEGEYRFLLDAISLVVGPENEEGWRVFLSIAWESGLRSGEIHKLTWDKDDAKGIFVDLKANPPVLNFRAGTQKNRKIEEVYIVPGFRAVLESIPESERHGRVAKIRTVSGYDIERQKTTERIFKTIATAAGIYQPSGQTVTLHDFRRAFGTRNSEKYSPSVLARLMRHSSIAVTMKFYQRHGVKEIAKIVEDAE